MITATKKLTHLFACLSAASLFGCGGVDTDATPSNIDPLAPTSDWKMVWSDEFDGTTINATKWSHEVNCDGGGNNEKQCYTDAAENSYVSDGTLKIVALPAAEGADLPYTSARLRTKAKGDWTYGRFEARIKMPSGQGSWPAFWMLPTDNKYGGWPHSGEIDIVEALNLKTEDADGNVESSIWGTLHYGESWPNNDHSGKEYPFDDGVNPADEFKTYAIEWQEGEIRWYVDGHLYQVQRKSDVKFNSENVAVALHHQGWYAQYHDPATGELTDYWDAAPFDQDFHLLLNLAVGGDWPENVNNLGVDADAFANGQIMEIDYVRVYQCGVGMSDGSGCETVRPSYLNTLDDAVNNVIAEYESALEIHNKAIDEHESAIAAYDIALTAEGITQAKTDEINAKIAEINTKVAEINSEVAEINASIDQINAMDENQKKAFFINDYSFTKGEAPIPVAPSTGVPATITLYDDALNENLVFNSYNPDSIISYSEVSVDGRGMVFQMDKGVGGGNMYLQSTIPYDLSAHGDNAELVFDMNVLSVDPDVELLVKLDSGWPQVSDVAIAPTAIGEWTEIRINIKTLLADENAYSAGQYADETSIVNPFVLDPTGVMSFQIDNVRILSGDSSGQTITLYDDAVTGDIAFDSYDPDNFVEASEVTVDGRGSVIEVVKSGPGGNWYLNSSTSPFDISGLNSDSELVFDMFVVSADPDVELLIKLDSGWPNVSDTVVDTSTVGEWVEVRLNLKTLLANENSYQAGAYADDTNIINPFVMEPSGAMTVQFDNIRYEEPGSSVEVPLYDDAVTGDITFDSYDPDNYVEASEVTEDGRGSVIEIVKSGPGGNWYLNSSTTPYDISGYGPNSELVFDMFVVSADPGVDLLIKLDSGWPNVSDVVVDTSTIGEWVEVKINLQTLLADENSYQAGAFADDTNLVNPFVMEPNGVMTVRFDNIRFVNK